MLAYYLSLIIDESAKSKFEQLYLLHRQTMLWIAKSILHDQSSAEDAVHDAFLRILNHLENFTLEDCNITRATFVVIVRNISIDMLRKQKRLSEANLDDYEDYLPDNQTNPELTWLEKEGTQTILAAMGSMKQSYADVLTLQVCCELSSQQIADLLDISPESTRVRLHRARKHLAEQLKEGR